MHIELNWVVAFLPLLVIVIAMIALREELPGFFRNLSELWTEQGRNLDDHAAQIAARAKEDPNYQPHN